MATDGFAEQLMDATEGISSIGEIRSGMLNSSRDKAVRSTAESAQKARVPEPFKAPEPIPRKFQARLNYDPFERDVFIEILDPETGDVLRRLPAESATEDDLPHRGGAVLDRLA